MPKKVNILRFISLLLILLTLLGTSMATYRYTTSKAAAAAQAKKANQKEDKQKATIQAVSFEAIISLVHFNLSQEFYLDFTPTFSKNLLFVHQVVEAPAFVNSYFENTFCHLIAINAP